MAKKEKYETEKGDSQHLEKRFHLSPKDSNTPASAFSPKRSSERPTTHVKVNKCDH